MNTQVAELEARVKELEAALKAEKKNANTWMWTYIYWRRKCKR